MAMPGCLERFRLASAAGCLDWEVHFGDSTVVRAHQHAAGSKVKTLARGGGALMLPDLVTSMPNEEKVDAPW